MPPKTRSSTKTSTKKSSFKTKASPKKRKASQVSLEKILTSAAKPATPKLLEDLAKKLEKKDAEAQQAFRDAPKESLEQFLFLLCRYDSVNIVDLTWSESVWKDNLKILVKELVDSGVNINCTCSAGRIPLFYAIENELREMGKILVENGADIAKICAKRRLSSEDCSCIKLATIAEMDNLVLEMLRKNPNFKAVEDPKMFRNIDYLGFMNVDDKEVLQLIINTGADLSAGNDQYHGDNPGEIYFRDSIRYWYGNDAEFPQDILRTITSKTDLTYFLVENGCPPPRGKLWQKAYRYNAPVCFFQVFYALSRLGVHIPLLPEKLKPVENTSISGLFTADFQNNLFPMIAEMIHITHGISSETFWLLSKIEKGFNGSYMNSLFCLCSRKIRQAVFVAVGKKDFMTSLEKLSLPAECKKKVTLLEFKEKYDAAAILENVPY